jgi:hypothetical protein
MKCWPFGVARAHFNVTLLRPPSVHVPYAHFLVNRHGIEHALTNDLDVRARGIVYSYTCSKTACWFSLLSLPS